MNGMILKLMGPVCAKRRVAGTLPRHRKTADHSFHVLKKSGRRDAEVLARIGGDTVSWAEGIEEIK